MCVRRACVSQPDGGKRFAGESFGASAGSLRKLIGFLVLNIQKRPAQELMDELNAAIAEFQREAKENQEKAQGSLF